MFDVLEATSLFFSFTLWKYDYLIFYTDSKPLSIYHLFYLTPSILWQHITYVYLVEFQLMSGSGFLKMDITILQCTREHIYHWKVTRQERRETKGMMNQQKTQWMECLCQTSIYTLESKHFVFFRKLICTPLLLILNGLQSKHSISISLSIFVQ